jgi:protein-S-isoprenylcysteine O-methyltransferase Ste14
MARAAPGRDAPGVIAPPPLIYLGALGLGFLLDALLPSASLSGTLATVLGVLLVAGGLVLAGSFVRAFRRANTPVDPGRATTAIVTTGPYRLSRNPGYLAMAMAYVGIALLTNTLWAFATLVPALILVDRAVIKREERYLERKFGGDYLRYTARTRRWL